MIVELIWKIDRVGGIAVAKLSWKIDIAGEKGIEVMSVTIPVPAGEIPRSFAKAMAEVLDDEFRRHAERWGEALG